MGLSKTQNEPYEKYGAKYLFLCPQFESHLNLTREIHNYKNSESNKVIEMWRDPNPTAATNAAGFLEFDWSLWG